MLQVPQQSITSLRSERRHLSLCQGITRPAIETTFPPQSNGHGLISAACDNCCAAPFPQRTTLCLPSFQGLRSACAAGQQTRDPCHCNFDMLGARLRAIGVQPQKHAGADTNAGLTRATLTGSGFRRQIAEPSFPLPAAKLWGKQQHRWHSLQPGLGCWDGAAFFVQIIACRTSPVVLQS